MTALEAAPQASSVAHGATLDAARSAASTATGGTGPLLRIIKWSGYNWLVFPGNQPGPEHTKLNSSLDAVHVDTHGRLHLAITKVNGVWRGAELESLGPVNYGTYHWVVDTKTAKFARSTVLGMFVYRPGSKRLTNEIDVEDSKFSHLAEPNNAQFAVQPYYAPHHYHQYYIKASHSHLYQAFRWLPGSPHGVVHFVSRAGTTSHAPVISRWSYRGSSVPSPFNEHLFIDLWLNTNRPPTGGSHTAIIRSFHFSPA